MSDTSTTRAKALALGIENSTPASGFRRQMRINYLNFKFRRRQDTQVAVLFAGVLAAGNIHATARRSPTESTPSIDFFRHRPAVHRQGLRPGGEREDQSLLTWPLSTGLNLGWQAHHLAAHLGAVPVPLRRLRARQHHGARRRDADEHRDQRPRPPDEYRRRGYSLTANGTWARRMSWRPWAVPLRRSCRRPRRT